MQVKSLCLHKITDEHFPSWPGMPIKTFEKLLKFIKKRYRICLPDHLDENSKQKQLILTFDDGYKDFYLNALPILEKHKIPAILNVVVNCVTENYQIWTQKLNDVVDTYVKDKSALTVETPNKTYRYDTVKENPEMIALEIFRNLLPYSQETRDSVISRLEQEAPGKINRTQMMTTEELVDASKRGIEIGSHSMTHTNLADKTLTDEQLNFEINVSKNSLEHMLQKTVDVFAWPNGLFAHKSNEIVKNSSYKYVLTVNNQTSTLNISESQHIIDRILIYSSEHWKNIVRTEQLLRFINR